MRLAMVFVLDIMRRSQILQHGDDVLQGPSITYLAANDACSAIPNTRKNFPDIEHHESVE